MLYFFVFFSKIERVDINVKTSGMDWYYLFFAIPLCSACMSISPSEPIEELNQAYEGSILKITATDIKTVQSEYSSDEFVIGVQFSVENVSNEDVMLTDSSIQAFYDDVVANSASGFFLADDFGRGVEIPPGKRAIRAYYLRAPKDVNIIELRVPEGYLSEQYVTSSSMCRLLRKANSY